MTARVGRKTSASVQDSGEGPRVAYRVRALIASHSTLCITGELPRTNRTTRELRIGDVIDERGPEHFEFPMNECLTIGTDFSIGIPVFTIDEWLENRGALLVSDLAPKIATGSPEATEVKSHARQLKKWIRGQVQRPGLEELLGYIGAEQREALVAESDALQRDVVSRKEESRRAKASLKEAEAQETETPEDHRKAEQLLAIYHDEGKALLRKAELMYGSAAAPGDELSLIHI